MKVTCPKCEFQGNIKDELIPDGGHIVKCPKCRERFHIKKHLLNTIENNFEELLPQSNEDIVLKEWQEFYSKIETLAPLDRRKKIPDIIKIAINNNENPNITIKRIREEVFNLNQGERNKEITDLGKKILRTENSLIHAEHEKEHINNNPDIIGVRLHHYGDDPNDPCPSGACKIAMEKGSNIKYSGSEITADFYFNETTVPWYPHCPHCHCAILRHLYKRDYLKSLE